MPREGAGPVARLWAERTENRGSLDSCSLPVLDDGASDDLRAKGKSLRLPRVTYRNRDRFVRANL